MLEVLSVAKLVIGSAIALGGLGAIAFVYLAGKKAERNKVEKANAAEIKKDVAIDAKPRPTSKSNRDSMRRGDF